MLTVYMNMDMLISIVVDGEMIAVTTYDIADITTYYIDMSTVWIG